MEKVRLEGLFRTHGNRRFDEFMSDDALEILAKNHIHDADILDLKFGSLASV